MPPSDARAASGGDIGQRGTGDLEEMDEAFWEYVGKSFMGVHQVCYTV